MLFPQQYYEKVCECGCVNNCEAPNCRIKYGDNLRALVTYLNVVQCIPFKKIAELISDLSGQNISEGTVQNILKENSGKADSAYEEIRKGWKSLTHLDNEFEKFKRGILKIKE